MMYEKRNLFDRESRRDMSRFAGRIFKHDHTRPNNPSPTRWECSFLTTRDSRGGISAPVS